MPREPNQISAAGRPADPKSATRDVARKRAQEIARGDGRGAADVQQWDYEQAKREVTGTTDTITQERILNGGSLAARKAGRLPKPADPTRPKCG